MRKYVGERIRKLREAQDMSLEQVCKLTGIDAARLAAYEDGTAVPPIGVVIQLSRVLGSKMEGLLHGGGTVSESLTICRSGESLGGEQGDTEQSYAYQSLTRPGTAGHLMEPFLLSFDPAVPPGVPITHDGQEFVYVVEGAIELFYDGRNYRLEKGDSAYLRSSLPHTFHGLGDSVAKMLAVVSSS
jgi:transcriptional regulator with XRE-family HTH domain